MVERFSSIYLHFSGLVFSIKNRLIQAEGLHKAVPIAVELIVVEILFTIVSLPLFIIVSPKKVQETGFIFPSKEKTHFNNFAARRKITLTSVFGAAAIYSVKVLFVGIVSFYLFGATPLLAAIQNWDFSTAGDYTYDSAKIEVTGGVAQLISTSAIGDAIINDVEFDETNGTEPDIIHVSGDVFAIAYTGPGSDGFIKTITVNSAGTIGSVIDTLEFDAGTGLSTDIVHVSGNIFAIAYEGPNNDGFVATVDIDTSGNIGASVIDSLEFDTAQASFTDIIHVSGNTFAIAYEGPNNDGFVATVDIDTSGNIGAAVIDSLEFDTTNGAEPTIIGVGGDYYAIAYSGPGSDGFVVTATIDAAGNISDSTVDSFEFDTANGTASSMINVSGTTYAIAYDGFGNDGFVVTVDIDTSGNIGATVIDSLEFDTAQALFMDIIHISGNIFSIAYEGPGKDGNVVIVNIDADGNIGDSVIDLLKFDPVRGTTPAIIAITSTVYAIVYSNTVNDGEITTFEITSNYDLTNPSIYPSSSLTMTKTISWNGFTETATKNGGEIYYQLSDDNGATWKYWDGAIWATAGTTNYNIATVVNTNIGSFPTTNNQIKWRAFLSSNGTQQVILDNIAIDYTENSLPVILNLSPAQGTSTGRVYITYDLQDADSDPQSLTAYEYSLTGAFSGEQVTMTAATGDPAHSGVSGLTASASGTPHTFVWDSFAQLGAVYNTSVYVRLRSNDGVGNGAYAASNAFAVDYVNPVVSNVVASQTSGTTNVQITYNLSDNTSDNLLVEIDISDDAGATWIVTDTSVSGAVGTGQTTGVLKTITWNAGADFNEQHQDDLQVRVRAKDKWQNQGIDVASANFTLDTLNPVVLTSVDLKAQPNAGDTTVLVGGSFIETNPNTNDFSVAINGGAYGSATSGTGNTATPSDQTTAVGSTLDGNDSISKVKITHTDDYGQTVDNENTSPSTSFKYVKPYTPQAPILSDPVTTVLDLTINPHASEAVDVQYAIYETTTNQYVQSNGMFGVNSVWQIVGITSGQWGNNTGISGKVHVSGLTSPVANYIFKVKSRNPSDSAHAISSESAFSATAQITNTAPSISFGTISQTTDGTNYVTINYTGTDGQGDVNSLTVFEYSSDNTIWFTMTEKSGVGSDGTSNLVFLPGGSAHDFMWDVGTDLPGIEDSTVYIRLRSSDTLATSSLTTSSAFEIDTVLPVVSSVSAVQNPGARTVAITYALTDANNSVIEIDISDDAGATWTITDTSVTGDVGSGITSGSKTITWNAGADFDNQYQTDLQVRVRARDTFGNQSANSASANFAVDTDDPAVTNITAVQDTVLDTFTFHYDVSEDVGNVTIGLEISNNGGSTWTVATTTAAGDVGTLIVPGASKTITWNATVDYNGFEKTNMRIRLTATDGFSNTSNTSSADFSLDTLAPRVTTVSASQTSGTTNVAITYTLADQNLSLVEIDISDDSGSTWTVTDTSVTGDVGSGISAGSKTITWNAGFDFNEQEQSDLRVRVRAKDIFEHQSANVESANFALDTVNPITNVSADLISQPNAGDTTVLIGGSFTETNPNANDFYVAINSGAYGSATSGTANTASPSNQATAVGATLDGNDFISKIKIVHTDDFGQGVTNENTSPNTAFKFVKPYTPAIPTVNNPTFGTVDVTINKNAAETDGLEYAIYEVTQNKYVQTDGTLGVSAVWRTVAQWGTVTVNGLLNDSYTYQFKTKSRNTSDVANASTSESEFSGSVSSTNQSPVITLGSISQTTDGSQYVTINYTGSDLESENSTIITAQYSTNGTTWNSMTEKSGVGSDGTVGLVFARGGTAHDFMWDVATDLSNTEDATVYIRLRANDGTSDGAISTSNAFTVDTKKPVVSSVTAEQQNGSNNVLITYTLTDLSNSLVEIDVSDDGGATWNVTDTSVTGDIGSGVTSGAGKTITWNPGANFSGQEQSDLRVRVRARDTFGNQGANTSSANFSVDTNSPQITNVTASQNVGLNTVTIGYDIADANTGAVVIEISEDNGSSWGVATTTLSGDVGAGITPGVGKIVTWNAAVDFPNREQSGMVVRVRATDSHNNLSGNVLSQSFSVDTLAPSISNVSAAQTLGTENVVFTYSLSDSGSVNISIDISDDSGATWTVADTSITGSVGASVTPGASKTITWNAGVDFSNQDQSDMRVRIRGTDGFNNISENVQSSNFSVDTFGPAINVTADLVSQPNAGQTTALIGGSFTETNPNTNDFSVAINGGAYGSATSGTGNTATPSNQATAIGATLDGNDYISKVKIVHTDDFAHSVTNENTLPNTALKYVKPYTPQAPTVNNPQNTSVDVTIVPHAAEAAGLEYSIFENTTLKYVQTNGSLGTNPVWQTTTAWGTKTVTGLTSPVANYAFKVKSRNISDTSNSTSSESGFSGTGFITNTSPSISITSVAQQTAATYALIEYTGTDTQNDTNNLSTFEYSTDGNSWSTMTEKSGVGSDGTTSLIFTSSGPAFTFAWDISADLPNTNDSTVNTRLRSTDTLTNSNLAVSSAFAIDTLGPIISNIQASQTPSSNIITFTYDFSDITGTGNTITLQISSDGGSTWTVPTTTATGDVGSGVSSGTGRSITWNAGVDFNNQENSTMKIRLQGTDTFGNTGGTETSSNFTVDTKGAVVSSVTAFQTDGTRNVQVDYTLSDLSTGGLFVEFSLSSDNGATWTVPVVTYSGNVGSGQTTGAKQFIWNAGVDFDNEYEADMKVRVRARDYFGNQGSFTSSSAFSADTKDAVVSNVTASQNTGARTVNIVYDLSDDTSTNLNVEFEVSDDNGMSWSILHSSSTGNVGAGQTTGVGKMIVWDAGVDFDNQDLASMRIRLFATDSFGNTSAAFESADFALDTADPTGLATFSKFASTQGSVTMVWGAASDTNFDHYELWYGNVQSDVQNRTGTALKWSIVEDSTLDNPLTVSTVITGFILDSDLFVKIWAVDAFGHEITATDVNVFTPVQVTTPPGGGGGSILDITPPGKPILNPLATSTNKTSIQLIVLSESSARIDLYDNGILVERLAGQTNSIGYIAQEFEFQEGAHLLTVTSTDSSGNVSEQSDSVSLVVDLTSPDRPIIFNKDNSEISETTPFIYGLSEPNTEIEITVDGLNTFVTSTEENGYWRYLFSNFFALDLGLHTFNVLARDAAGNESEISVLTLIVISPPILPSAPAVTPTPSVPIVPITVPSIIPTSPVLVELPPSVPPVPVSEIIQQEVEAIELPGLPTPDIKLASTVIDGRNFVFAGTAIPNSDIVVYIHSQALVYQSKADAEGNWYLTHSQDTTELTKGEHSIYAVSIDPVAKVKSSPAPIKIFTVKKSLFVSLFNYLNLRTTIVSVLVLSLCVWWLFRLRKKSKV